MKRIKFKELTLIILVAILFFIIGNMANQLNIYASVKDYFSPLINTQKVEKTTENFLQETQYGAYEISSLSLNKALLQDSEKPLKFLVTGHIYGNPYEEDLFHPATTLMTNIQIINQFELDMVVLLGDIVKESTEENFSNFSQNFLSYFTIPVFNAVGNHDIENRDLYIEKFGKTNFSFLFKEHLFIFLDTNIETYSLTDNQLDFIEDTISKSLGNNNVKSIHVFAHHVFFFENPNNSSSPYYRTNVSYSMDRNVEKFIYKFLIPLSRETPIFLYTGDVGAWCGNLSPYYRKYDGSKVTAIATGIGNCEEDSILIIEEINNEITLAVFSLLGKEMMTIDYYDDNYWKSR